MSNTSDLAVMQRATALFRTAPQAWEAFIQALSDRGADAKDVCVTAPPDMLVTAQGRAQEAMLLLKLLRDAPAKVTEIEAKRSPQKP